MKCTKIVLFLCFFPPNFQKHLWMLITLSSNEQSVTLAGTLFYTGKKKLNKLNFTQILCLYFADIWFYLRGRYCIYKLFYKAKIQWMLSSRHLKKMQGFLNFETSTYFISLCFICGKTCSALLTNYFSLCNFDITKSQTTTNYKRLLHIVPMVIAWILHTKHTGRKQMNNELW